jgi:hypothetical protein
MKPIDHGQSGVWFEPEQNDINRVNGSDHPGAEAWMIGAETGWTIVDGAIWQADMTHGYEFGVAWSPKFPSDVARRGLKTTVALRRSALMHNVSTDAMLGSIPKTVDEIRHRAQQYALQHADVNVAETLDDMLSR